jgi:hypothetical protein
VKLPTGTWLSLLEVGVKGPRSYVGLPGVYLTPRNCLYAPRNRTKVSGSERTPRAKTCVPGADKAANRNVADFVSGDGECTSYARFSGPYDYWAHMFQGQFLKILRQSR